MSGRDSVMEGQLTTAGPNMCSHRAAVAHVSGLSSAATILAVVAKFQMFRGRAIGHGLCDHQRQGVPRSSRTLDSVRSHALFVVVMLSVGRSMGLGRLRGIAHSGVKRVFLSQVAIFTLRQMCVWRFHPGHR